ncbi:MAG TPA: FAD-dependent oxidoreductase [Cytophagaceae bacterium]|nr:FAD-dependent oxidoreductase [Cytophagaceae bacterium]
MNIAIIGTGIAGMGCGHFLHKKHNLTFFEQNNYVGGHTNTAYVENDKPVDTGFIVFNDITYPNLVRLFKKLNVDVYNTDMSFSVQHVPSNIEYCGSSLNLIFAQRKNIFSPKFIKFILEIGRFNKECTKILDNPIYEKYSMLDYVKEEGYSDDFLYKYLAPMSSALWSTPTDITIKFPAVALVRFFKNHGLLGLSTQYQWKTVRNGSWAYRDKLIAPFKDQIKINTGVQKVTRIGDKVKVYDDCGGETEFDKVILACHADQALGLLGNDATALEKYLLGNFEYQKNIATLHTDVSLMPKIRKTWSAWNYRIETVKNELVAHTIYYMNKLQDISKKNDYFLSINQPNTVDPAKILKTIEYEHPIFTPEAYKAQGELHKLNENGQVYFCGSYFKYGFHEDAFTSAVNLCTKLLGKDCWEE